MQKWWNEYNVMELFHKSIFWSKWFLLILALFHHKSHFSFHHKKVVPHHHIALNNGKEKFSSKKVYFLAFWFPGLVRLFWRCSHTVELLHSILELQKRTKNVEKCDYPGLFSRTTTRDLYKVRKNNQNCYNLWLITFAFWLIIESNDFNHKLMSWQRSFM